MRDLPTNRHFYLSKKLFYILALLEIKNQNFVKYLFVGIEFTRLNMYLCAINI